MNKRIMKSAKALVMAFLLSVMLVPAAAMAGEASEGAAQAMLKIPVTVNATGDASADIQYEFQIESVTDGAPMPANDTLTITGLKEVNGVLTASGEFVFSAGAFTIPDDYNYKITQTTKSTDKVKKLDDSVYYITVRVLNEENGSQLVVWARKNEDGSHYNNSDTWGKDSIVFTNEFQPPATVIERTYTTVTRRGVKTGDETNMTLWITLVCISIVGVGLLLRNRSRE